jgi:four helix bundle protein
MNENIKDFYDLEVWQRSNKVTIAIYKITMNFPKDERFGLTDQVRRSASSISANIAEGFNRYHANDKIRFYLNARGSISESKSHIMLSRGLGYIAEKDAQALLRDLAEIEMMLNGLINSIRRCAASRAP